MSEMSRLGPADNRLYDLLPATYRIRDGQVDEQLRRLLAVIGEQLQLVEDDLGRLYDNWFIETCEDWLVPYLGDLVGYRMTGSAAALADPVTSQRRQLANILFPRSAVANTVRSRRRKGTLALLEELATDLADWPARAVEFYRLLGVTQPIHLLGTNDAVPLTWRGRGRTMDLRDGELLDLVHGPFDTAAHTVDLRRPTSARTRGRYNIPSVGVFAWRLRAYSVTESSAVSLEDEDPHRYTFSVLGNDAPVFNRPQRASDPTGIATETELPVPIRRRALERHPEAYVGEGKSIKIGIGRPPAPIPADRVIATDLDRWRYRPQPGTVAVDPERGRMLFAHDLLGATREGVTVSYLYGFSDDIGGGEYDRPLTAPTGAEVRRVRGVTELIQQLSPWLEDEQTDSQPPHAVIEITDSAVYDVALHLRVRAGNSLQLRAGPRCRPVLRLSDRTPGPDALNITGADGSKVVLDGLWVIGNAVQVDGDIAAFTIRHCTLVPGWGLGPDCQPKRPARPSVELIDTQPRTCIEHSIVGSIQVTLDNVRLEPVSLNVSDSIVDATAPERAAICALGGGRAHAVGCFVRVTMIGTAALHAVALGENSLFDGRMDVARRQVGCLRFCSILPGSRTPRRYRCQPDLVDAVVNQAYAPGVERDQARSRERLRLRPEWNSTRYGTPDYCQLSTICAAEITRGADDESEMGAFHDLFQPQRAATLQSAFDEFTPANMDAAVFFATARPSADPGG